MNKQDKAIIKAISNSSVFTIEAIQAVHEQTKCEKTTRSALYWAEQIAVTPMMIVLRPKIYGLELVDEEYRLM